MRAPRRGKQPRRIGLFRSGCANTRWSVYRCGFSNRDGVDTEPMQPHHRSACRREPPVPGGKRVDVSRPARHGMEDQTRVRLPGLPLRFRFERPDDWHYRWRGLHPVCRFSGRLPDPGRPHPRAYCHREHGLDGRTRTCRHGSRPTLREWVRKRRRASPPLRDATSARPRLRGDRVARPPGICADATVPGCCVRSRGMPAGSGLQ